MFEILLPKEMKPNTMVEVYLLVEPFIRARWPFHYGLTKKRPTSALEYMAGGIPTSHGCLVLWYLGLDWPPFFREASDKLDGYVLDELKELIAKGNYMKARRLLHRLDRSKLKSILLARKGLVKHLEYELILSIPIPTEVEGVDVELEISSMARSLGSLLDFRRRVVEGKSPFLDVELLKWRVPMADPLEIYGIYEEFSGDVEEVLKLAVSELLAIIHESMSRPAYIAVVRGDVNAERTLSDFEAELSRELSPIVRYVNPSSIFATLVS